MVVGSSPVVVNYTSLYIRNYNVNIRKTILLEMYLQCIIHLSIFEKYGSVGDLEGQNWSGLKLYLYFVFAYFVINPSTSIKTEVA